MPVLVVQMGHAGRTSGATGAPGEQAFAQAVGAECARLLARDGWTVRSIVADPAPSLYRGAAFVAIHADGSNNPAVRGASVGYQTTQGGDLAHAWRDAYVRRGFTGPWHPDNYTDNLHYYYGVTESVRQGNRRACIVECGTITNAEDRALMDPTRVAFAIGDAVGIAVEEDDDMFTPEDHGYLKGLDSAVGYTFASRGRLAGEVMLTIEDRVKALEERAARAEQLLSEIHAKVVGTGG